MDQLKQRTPIPGERLELLNVLGSLRFNIFFNFDGPFDIFVYGLNNNQKWFDEEFLCFYAQKCSQQHPKAYQLHEQAQDDKNATFELDLEYCSKQIGIHQFDLLIYPEDSASVGDLKKGEIIIMNTDGTGHCVLLLKQENMQENFKDFSGLLALRFYTHNNTWKFQYLNQGVKEDPLNASVRFYGAEDLGNDVIRPDPNETAGPKFDPLSPTIENSPEASTSPRMPPLPSPSPPPLPKPTIPPLPAPSVKPEKQQALSTGSQSAKIKAPPKLNSIPPPPQKEAPLPPPPLPTPKANTKKPKEDVDNQPLAHVDLSRVIIRLSNSKAFLIQDNSSESLEQYRVPNQSRENLYIIPKEVDIFGKLSHIAFSKPN